MTDTHEAFEDSPEYIGYKESVSRRISESLESKMTQPVIFAGSGLSRRYANTPNWHGLLAEVSKYNSNLREYNYYLQSGNTQEEIGSIIAAEFYEYAWADGKEEFPSSLFNSTRQDVFFKHTIAKVMKSYPFSLDLLSENIKEEIQSLARMQPNTIVTTNYDSILEKIFPQYSPVVGEELLKIQPFYIGKIYKIHGTVEDPESMVATKQDYDDFIDYKKYLSAKLLTYFIEHPILFVGYSIDDRNIKLILQDIDMILSRNNLGLDNIFFLKFCPDLNSRDLQREVVISLPKDRSVRVNCISARDYKWVFDAFGKSTNLAAVDPNMLNQIMSRMYKLIRTDIPQRTIDYSFETINKAAHDMDELASLLGIAPLDDKNYSVIYRHTYTELANSLGVNRYGLETLFKRVKTDHYIDLKASDNKYHQRIRTGEKSVSHKYSDEIIVLFGLLQKNLPYEIDLQAERKAFQTS